MKKRLQRLALLAAAFLATLSPLAQQAAASPDNAPVTTRHRLAPGNLRVLTANIRFPLDTDKNGTEWPVRHKLCCEVLAAQDADILCLQEGREPHLPYVRAAFPGYDAYTCPNPSGDQTHRPDNIIFYSSKRFQKIAAGGHWLSDTPDVPRSKFADSGSVRYVNWLHLRDTVANSELVVWNTHLDHLNQSARDKQAAVIVRFTNGFRPSGLPAILTGDFNCGVTSKAIQTIKAAGWSDSYASLHGPDDPGFTFHNWKGPRQAEALKAKNRASKKIDFIFNTARLKPVAAEIIRDSRDGKFPSDHYFVSAEFEYSP
ncbi:MAG: endonuclease/exonuclease/phosphatase family protein [Opitutaceae bacterium]|jgi:endonuclease/exonuclease/phosphatase family metal-dependent hydrolase|nr:endonuclease/exonuclease/phosphatase family protein [Opitutaceae bacterium]